MNDNIERIDYNEVCLEEFIEKYEKTYKPVIITNAQILLHLKEPRMN